jgi:hypothetical protein
MVLKPKIIGPIFKSIPFVQIGNTQGFVSRIVSLIQTLCKGNNPFCCQLLLSVTDASISFVHEAVKDGSAADYIFLFTANNF